MSKVYKSYIIPIKESQKTIDYLYQCNKETARVWNECVRLSKELWKNEQKYSDRKYLQDNIKGNFSDIIPAKAMQITIKKYLGAVRGIQRARKASRTDLKYPWREKKNYNTIWDSMMFKVDYKKNIIKLSKPKTKENKNQNPIIIHSKYFPKNIVYAELTYNGGLFLALNYWEEESCFQIESNNISAIDFGEIHSITSTDNLGNNQIITGRKIRSEQRFRNKELTKLNRRLSKCTKGSRNYKKYRKAISKLMGKSERKMRNNLKKTAKMYSDYVLINNIKTIVVGDLSNFNMNFKKQKNKKGRYQKLVQWTHGRIKELLENNLIRHGVDIVEISEAYTSQTCPKCGDKHKPTGRNYVCNKCGFTIHRDVLGSYNILSKYINNGEIKDMNIELKPLKYLRIDC